MMPSGRSGSSSRGGRSGSSSGGRGGSSSGGSQAPKHPQLISPNNSTEVDFSYAAPFVSIGGGLFGKDFNKLSGGSIEGEVLYHIFKEYVEPSMMLAREAYHGKNEMSGRPVLSTFWPTVTQFSDRDLQIENTVDDSIMKEVEGEEAVEDSFIDSFEFLDICHEDRSVMKKEGAIDYAFKVVDRNLTAQKGSEVYVWKALAEAKDALLDAHWEEKVVWQLARYGVAYGLDNAKSGRFAPVYLIGVHLGNFAVAEVHCFGVISVRNGEISSQSYEEYQTQEAQYVEKMEKKDPLFAFENVTFEALTAKLQSLKSRMLHSYPDYQVLDRDYLVGKLYKEKEVYKWDDFGMTRTVPESFTCYFIEYLLRVLVGEKVRKWTVNDVKKIVEEKKKLLYRAPLQNSRNFNLTYEEALQEITRNSRRNARVALLRAPPKRNARDAHLGTSSSSKHTRGSTSRGQDE